MANTFVHANCSTMWNTIIVPSSARLNLSNTWIEDAKTGISATSGSQLNIQGTHFYKNYIGLNFASANFMTATMGSFTFANNELHCDNTSLLAPYSGAKSYAGIGGNKFSLFLSGVNNYFHDMQNGIKMTASSLTANNCQFKNITTTGIDMDNPSTPHNPPTYLVQQGLGQNASPTFDNCFRGISAKNMNVSIIDNLMENVYFGVFCGLSPKTIQQVKNNTINAFSVGINMTLNDPVKDMQIENNIINISGQENATWGGYSGIYISEFKQNPLLLNATLYGNRIKNNTITLNKALYGIFLNTANGKLIKANTINLYNIDNSNLAGINNISSDDGDISCNRVYNSSSNYGNMIGLNVSNSRSLNTQGISYTCNGFYNTYEGVKFAGDCSNTYFGTNQMHTNGYGLHLTKDAKIGMQNITGNQWFTLNNYIAAVHDGTMFQANQSQFKMLVTYPYYPVRVKVNNVTYQLPATINAQTWFNGTNSPNPNCGYDEVNCGLTSNADESNPVTASDYEIALNNYLGAEYPETNRWEAERFLYERILNDSSLLQDSILFAFSQQYTNSNGASFEAVESGIDGIQLLNPIDDAYLRSKEAEIQELQDSLAGVISLIEASPEDSLLLNLKIDIETALATAQSQYDNAWAGWIALREGQIALLQTENGLLPDTTIYQTNQRKVNAIYLNRIARGRGDFSTEDSTDLYYIANQCPLSGGSAVFLARSLYSYLYPTAVYDDQALCLQSGIQYRKAATLPEQKSINYKIYPNPTQGIVCVEWLNIESETPRSLVLKDLMGRTVKEMKWETGISHIDWDLNDLTQGVYHLAFKAANQTLYSEKLILVD